jgi:ADP-ribose pyrophosphatase
VLFLVQSDHSSQLTFCLACDQVSDPGLTSANMKLVIVDVKLTEEDPEPEAKLDEGEHIVKRVVEVKDLWKTLEGESERSASPDLY